MKWIVGSSNHGWLGTYELNKQQVLERFVRTGMVVKSKNPIHATTQHSTTLHMAM
jgi:hypothetical protein